MGRAPSEAAQGSVAGKAAEWGLVEARQGWEEAQKQRQGTAAASGATEKEGGALESGCGGENEKGSGGVWCENEKGVQMEVARESDGQPEGEFGCEIGRRLGVAGKGNGRL